MTFVLGYDTTDGLDGETIRQEHGSLAIYGPLADRRKLIGRLVRHAAGQKVVQANFQHHSLAATRREVGLYDDKYPANPVLALFSYPEDQDARDYVKYILKRGMLYGITAVIGFDRVAEGMGPVASKAAQRVVAVGENRHDTYQLLTGRALTPEVAHAASDAYMGTHWRLVPALLA